MKILYPKLSRPGQLLTSLHTPYYRPIGQEAEPNHSPYQLFVLVTRLAPLTRKLLGSGIYYQFVSVRDGSIMRMTLVPYRGALPAPLSPKLKEQLEAEIKLIISQDATYCLLYSTDVPLYRTTGQPISASWIWTILPYLHYPANIPSFVRAGGVYMDLSQQNNYYDLYTNLNIQLVEEIRDWYERGYITGMGALAENYDLEVISKDGMLWRPRWFELGLTPISEFLESLQLRGVVSYRVGELNLVVPGDIKAQQAIYQYVKAERQNNIS